MYYYMSLAAFNVLCASICFVIDLIRPGNLGKLERDQVISKSRYATLTIR